MKTFATIATFALCLAATAHAQMDQSQSQAARAALNSQQAAAAQQQLDQNVVNQAVHDDMAASRDAQIVDNDVAYERAMHAHHADVRAYHRALRMWHADVMACKAGDHSRCDHPMPQ